MIFHDQVGDPNGVWLGDLAFSLDGDSLTIGGTIGVHGIQHQVAGEFDMQAAGTTVFLLADGTLDTQPADPIAHVAWSDGDGVHAIRHTT